MACKRGRCLGSPRAEPRDAGEVFKIIFKVNERLTILRKKFQFFDKFNGKFCKCFRDFQKIYRIFRENLEKIRKNLKYAFVGGSGGGVHRSKRIYLKRRRKIDNQHFLIIVKEILPVFKNI